MSKAILCVKSKIILILLNFALKNTISFKTNLSKIDFFKKSSVFD